MNSIKQITIYILVGLVFIFTTIAILGIWEVISMEDVLIKILKSLFVIFIASLVLIVVFSLVKRDGRNDL